jgi:hypothetical protein
MLRVKGSLQKHLAWWQDNVKNDYIVKIIAEGYKLPLLAIPQDSWIKNNKSARDNEVFVDEEIGKLLESGVIIKSVVKPTVVNALSVATNSSGKHRLVLDLRNVNPMLNVASFKYENIAAASNYFQKKGHMITFDLKSGYHHVDIHRAYCQYLGFEWKNSYYFYTTCPFGLSVAGLIFSKILRELVKLWRTRGFAIVMYLDDGFLSCSTFEAAVEAAHSIKTDLINSGFIINEQKSHWIPRQSVTWLGFELDSEHNTFHVPEAKLVGLKAQLRRNLYFSQHCSARELAKSVGIICSMFHAFGPAVYLLTKSSTRWIEDRLNWSNRAPLTDMVIHELKFWLNNMTKVPLMPLVPEIMRETLIIYSDASATGCGALVLNNKALDMVHQWNPQERLYSSTWRELKAIAIYINIHKLLFKGKALKWYTDNLGVTSVIIKGSMKLDLHLCSLEIYESCIKFDILLSVDWVPRKDNVDADRLSKQEDVDDWGVDHGIYNVFNTSHGPFTVDIFATNITAKSQKFYSRYWCDKSSGVDAFAYDWGSETCWLVPPPRHWCPKL